MRQILIMPLSVLIFSPFSETKLQTMGISKVVCQNSNGDAFLKLCLLEEI